MPFITFEGVEGCGKSTQMRLAARRLRAAGRSVVETREPGGTDIGGKIRDILMDPTHTHLDPVAEWLLYEADRRQHVREVLAPAVARGDFVLCDRYSDATEAYQQEGRGVEASTVRAVDALARDGLEPDLTLLYDVDPQVGLERARQRDGGVGRFEAAEGRFHDRVRAAYFEIARREPRRVAIIAGKGSAEEVFGETWRRIASRFGL
ncbi:MAG: dTMP kinase [Thermoanaerobaculia bacterium]